jgi:cell division protein FtsB
MPKRMTSLRLQNLKINASLNGWQNEGEELLDEIRALQSDNAKLKAENKRLRKSRSNLAYIIEKCRNINGSIYLGDSFAIGSEEINEALTVGD